MTDQDIIELGALCEVLLADPQFKTIIAHYEQSCAADMLGTKAHETEKREQLYHSLWGMREFLSYMQLNADAARRILRGNETDSDDEFE